MRFDIWQDYSGKDLIIRTEFIQRVYLDNTMAISMTLGGGDYNYLVAQKLIREHWTITKPKEDEISCLYYLAFDRYKRFSKEKIISLLRGKYFYTTTTGISFNEKYLDSIEIDNEEIIERVFMNRDRDDIIGIRELILLATMML